MRIPQDGAGLFFAALLGLIKNVLAVRTRSGEQLLAFTLGVRPRFFRRPRIFQALRDLLLAVVEHLQHTRPHALRQQEKNQQKVEDLRE